MAKYIAFHTLKKSADEFLKAITAGSAGIAQAMAAGKTPARCLKTWNPIPHGRTDYVFCLWEADKAEDVVATIEQFRLHDYLTVDNMKVDEIDWPEMAKTV